MSEVCIITGVGPGTGSALVRRFAAEGYQVAMIARDKQRLINLQSTIERTRSYPCDVSDANALASTLDQILVEMGPPRILIHNAVAAARGDYLSVDTKAMNTAWQVNVMALLTLSRWATPLMVEREGGVILCTGNTAAYRGKAHFAGFAPTKAAQRILMESIARHAGPQGIHAAFLAIDAVIDLEWTRKAFPDRPDDFFCHPDDIATACFDLAHQPKSAWASEMVIRPFGETW